MICGKPCQLGRTTCSDDCHEKLVYQLEQEFGPYKKVVDETTGLIHKVPTRDIIERGLKQTELHKYPLWLDKGVK
jgi:hypothetical protein